MVGQLGNRVLLVDDEPLIRKLISGNLVAAGYVVQTAADGLDALGKLRAGLPDLIISDLNMPRMSGLELLAVVRKRFPQIPVLVISSVPPDEMPREVAADAYYHKNGFGFQPLLETISDLTRKLPLRAPPPPIDNEPAQVRWDGNGQYIIGCKDCLREFNVPRTANIMRAENWTACVHCGKLVQFLVAEHSEGK
jgi:CheY-like chemotaxis protein